MRPRFGRIMAPAIIAFALGACALFDDAPKQEPPPPPTAAVAVAPPPERPPPEKPEEARPEGPWLVLFDFDRVDIGEEGRREIEKAWRAWARDRSRPIVVIGHADAVGTPEYNLILSQRRARAVADALAAHGVDSSRITVGAVGATEPAGAAREQRRRVEIRLAAR